MVIEFVDDDDRQYSTPEKETLTRNLYRLSHQVRTIDSKTRPYSVELICDWHRQLFGGVRDHAGRVRSSDFGEDRLMFGPHRSLHRTEVHEALVKHVQDANWLLDQLYNMDAQVNQLEFVKSVLHACLYVHAELIRIHPFRDGNGRVSRLCITYYLCKFGLPPLAFEVLKQEYIDCLNHYYTNGQIEPLLKLALRVFNNLLFA